MPETGRTAGAAEARLDRAALRPLRDELHRLRGTSQPVAGQDRGLEAFHRELESLDARFEELHAADATGDVDHGAHAGWRKRVARLTAAVAAVRAGRGRAGDT